MQSGVGHVQLRRMLLIMMMTTILMTLTPMMVMEGRPLGNVWNLLNNLLRG